MIFIADGLQPRDDKLRCHAGMMLSELARSRPIVYVSSVTERSSIACKALPYFLLYFPVIPSTGEHNTAMVEVLNISEVFVIVALVLQDRTLGVCERQHL